MSKRKSNPQKASSRQRFALSTEITVAIISGVVTIIAAIIPAYLNKNDTSNTSAVLAQTLPANISDATLTDIPPTISTSTNTPKPVSMPTRFTASPTELPAEYVDEKGFIMRLVPESDFIMGSENGFGDEKPTHLVHLSAYYIDQYEITNLAYAQCVKGGVCQPPLKTYSYTHKEYYSNPKYDAYPVMYVTWEMANKFCSDWRGGRLPTEAQWEKAAKGTDSRLYPWGSDFNGANLNYCDVLCNPPDVATPPVEHDSAFNDGYADTAPVGKFMNGVSPYGAYDMAGNVWEWVYDWYSDYNKEPATNPSGPESGKFHVLRGGSWASDQNFVRVTNRRHLSSTVVGSVPASIGFRCALEIKP